MIMQEINLNPLSLDPTQTKSGSPLGKSVDNIFHLKII